MTTKPARASKTLWGLLLVFLPILQQVGVQLELHDIITIGNSIDSLYLLATQLVGFLLALYGRMNATKALTL